MERAGSAQLTGPTTRAGTPATVMFGGTSCSTTLPGGMFSACTISSVAEHFRSSANQNARANLGMPIARHLAAAAERDRMQERAVVAHDRGFTDDEAGGVIEHDAASKAGGRMDIR